MSDSVVEREIPPSAWPGLLDALRTLPRAPLPGGQDLLRRSEWGSVSLWWFVRDDFLRLAEEWTKGTTASGEKIPPRTWREAMESGLLLALAYLAYQVFAFLVSRIIAPVGLPSEGKDRLLIITPNHQWRTLSDAETGRARKGDAFFDSILRRINEQGSLTALTTYTINTTPYPWYWPFPGIKTILSKRRHPSGAVHQPLDAYWSPAIGAEIGRARRHFSEVWKELASAAGSWGGDLPPAVRAGVERRLAYYLHTIYPRAVGVIEMGKRMLERVQPKAVVVIAEYGPLERGLVVAAKLKGIPVMAIQHGVIHPSHPGYMYEKDEVSLDGSVASPFCPIPDLTAVYAPYHQELLTQVSAYPAERVAVTGAPRYDVLFQAERVYSRSGVRRELGVDPQKKVILWTTQTHGLPADENVKNVDAMFEVVARLDDIELVVKLHPGEDQRAPLYRTDPRLRPHVVGGGADTNALIYACDLLVTKHSTTAVEAIILEKPVIVLNLSGEPDPVEYVQEGVARGVYQKEDLPDAMEELLSDDAPLAKNRKRYIERYLYRVDGKATERVVELMDSMMERAGPRK